MTKEQKNWQNNGFRIAQDYPHIHPDHLIQAEWNRGAENCSAEVLGGFDKWHELFDHWASGVKKGSKYFENH